MKQVHIKLTEEQHKKLRLHCAEHNVSIQDYVNECIENNYVDKDSKPSNFKFIDLFAGIGGIRIPFDELGGTCVFSSEIDKFARLTYQSYFGHLPSGDIETIAPCDIPSFDLLLAGFPCQPFSQAGLKKGFNDTRGTLFFQIEKILRCKMPKAFLLENVKGLKGHDKGRTFQVIMDTLESIGYSVKAKVLAAKDFNLPQLRERIYIVGFLNAESAKKFEFPLPIEKQMNVGNILETEVEAKYTISDKLWSGHQRRKNMHKEKGNGFGYSIFDENSDYVSTISARYYKDGSEILIAQKNNNPRKITPLEAARIQGFPDQIVHEARKNGVSDAQFYKQFGNAVAVNVVRNIAQSMKPFLISTLK